METQEKQMDEKEALKILNETISVAKGNLDDGYFYFIIWGCVFALINLSNFFLHKNNLHEYASYNNVFYMLGGIASFIFSRKQNKKQQVNTYIENWMAYVWISFAVQFVIVSVFFNGATIAPVFLALLGGATFLCGGLVKYKPLIIGGILFWMFSLCTIFVTNEFRFLLVAAAMIVGNVIPGFMYRTIYKKENV